MSPAASRRLFLSSLGLLLTAGALHSFDLASKRDAYADEDDCVASVTVNVYRMSRAFTSLWLFVFVCERDGAQFAWTAERVYDTPTDEDWSLARHHLGVS